MKVIVTGASGFIGGKLCARLTSDGHDVVACSRSRVEQPGIFYAPAPELGRGCDTLHCISKLHGCLKEQSLEPVLKGALLKTLEWFWLGRDLDWTPPFSMEEGLRRALAEVKE